MMWVRERDQLLRRGARLGERLPRARDELVHPVAHDRQQQVLLSAHVVVEGGGGEAGVAGDVPDPGGGVAVGGEQAQRGLADPRTGIRARRSLLSYRSIDRTSLSIDR
jgi:hypothetical protein